MMLPTNRGKGKVMCISETYTAANSKGKLKISLGYFNILKKNNNLPTLKSQHYKRSNPR